MRRRVLPAEVLAPLEARETVKARIGVARRVHVLSEYAPGVEWGVGI